MVTAVSEGGDLRRSIALLWGVSGAGRRGPKPSRSVDEVVLAAIAIADSEGLPALSMRRVAEALNLSPMSLYTYVPSKAELVDLMIDRAAAEIREPDAAAPGWRSRVEHLSRERWLSAQRHPWLSQVGSHRPPLGPNVLAKIEANLRAFAELGLGAIELNQLNGVVMDYVRGSARAAIDARATERESGVTDQQWWARNEVLLQGVLDPAVYPAAVALGEAYKASGQPAIDHAATFEFGLQRVLDGIELFVANRSNAA